MALIEMQDVVLLWDNLPSYDWYSTRTTIEGLQGKFQYLDTNLVYELIDLAKDFEYTRRPFPKSEEDFYYVLNEELQRKRTAQV